MDVTHFNPTSSCPVSGPTGKTEGYPAVCTFYILPLDQKDQGLLLKAEIPVHIHMGEQDPFFVFRIVGHVEPLDLRLVPLSLQVIAAYQLGYSDDVLHTNC